MSYLKPLTKKESVKKLEHIHDISKLRQEKFVKEFPEYKEHLESNPQGLCLYQFAVISARLDILMREVKGG